MRLLHLADVHLDTPFAGRTAAVRTRLRDASLEAIERAFDLAVERSADAVLIAGDLLDGPHLSFDTESFLLDQLRRLADADIQVVYATGNHDPGRAGLRAHRLDWPDNVTVVGGRAPVRIPILRGANEIGGVTAAGHETDRETADLSRDFERPPGTLPEVAMLHTQVLRARAAREHEPYAPSELAWLEECGFDYWALGHVHTRQGLSEAAAIHYPGNPQGRTPKESGARGGLWVEVAPHAPAQVDFHAFGPVRWETVEVEGLEQADSLDRILQTFRGAWEAARAADVMSTGFEWIVRMRPTGPCPLWKAFSNPEETRTLAEEFAALIGALDVAVEPTGVHPPVDVDDHLDREDALGASLRLARSVLDGGRLPGLDKASLAGLELDPTGDADAYVRSLLEGIEGELLRRLLAES